jgi:hypothetical protein
MKICQSLSMNTASTDFPKHIGILHERMEHATDYETAIHYFLEEFAGDVGFVKESAEEDSPQLAAVVAKVVHDALGERMTTANN